MATTSAIRAGAAYVELYLKDHRLVRGLHSTSRRLKALGTSLMAVGSRATAVGTALTTPFVGAAKVFADMGSHMLEMSQRTGASVEALSTLSYAAEQSGADVHTLETSLTKMQKFLAKASHHGKDATKVLTSLGVSLETLKKLSPDEQFKLLGDRVSQIKDPAERAAVAMALFGKTGTKMLPLFAEGAADVERLQAQARRLGLEMSGEDAAAAEAFGDALSMLWKMLKQTAFTVGSAVAPTLKSLAEALSRNLAWVIRWIRENKQLIVTGLKVAGVILAIGAAITTVGATLWGVGSVLGFLGSLIAGVGAAIGLAGAALAKIAAIVTAVMPLILTPLGAIGMVFLALAGYFAVASGQIGAAITGLRQLFSQLAADATEAFGAIGQALAAGEIGLAAQILWSTLKLEWMRGVAFLNAQWQGWKSFFLRVVNEAVHLAASIFTDGVALFWTAWTETVDGLADAWSWFTTFLTKSWNSTVGFLQKAWAWLKSLIDEDLNVEAEFKRIDQETKSSNESADTRMAEDVGKREEARKRTRAEVEANRQGAQSALDQTRSAEDAAIQSAADASIAAAQAELDQLSKEWRGHVDKSKTLPDLLADGRDQRSHDVASGLDDSLTDAKGKFDVQGTFNAAAVRGFGADSLGERTARAAEITAKNTKQIEQEIKRRRPAFT